VSVYLPNQHQYMEVYMSPWRIRMEVLPAWSADFLLRAFSPILAKPEDACRVTFWLHNVIWQAKWKCFLYLFSRKLVQEESREGVLRIPCTFYAHESSAWLNVLEGGTLALKFNFAILCNMVEQALFLRPHDYKDAEDSLLPLFSRGDFCF
jgi:hypothetical protein